MAKEEQLYQSSNKLKHLNVISSITAINNDVIVRDMDFAGRRLSSGIWLLSDDGKAEGIRPRWGKVYAVGPKQTDVKPGQWVYIEHGRWTRGFEVEIAGEQFTVRKIDPKCMIFISDEAPSEDETISTALSGK